MSNIERTDGLQELIGDFQPGTVERLQDAVLTLSGEKQQAVRERDEARHQLRGAVALLDELAYVLADVSHGVVPRDGSVVRDVLKRATQHAGGR